ncbi:threonine aldolase family protein [Paragemmobacter straminiformis]|uniref:L-threonine aldolase n=1 Tax=Paragemmobacter straminiformis TaxID=2045119 RepID=A0A842I633_9RHOB|nr:low specificity L-threonine aldolase [Gemmobacter straminiformis]MBC2834873.1 low specificity L-threonine aldolase [Gemmobacter straminiformis]
MFFASDNTSGAPAEVMNALLRANEGYDRSYGNDRIMADVTARIRDLFEAPEAAVYLVPTGTAANALAIATLTPPWGAVFCHRHAHIAEDECGAPEFYASGAKLVLVEGAHGRMTPETLAAALATTGASGVHGVQRGMLSLTNVTEAGTLYTPAEIAALTALAKAHGLPCHLDGARFANAIVATKSSPAEMTWRAGIDVLSFGGTKNGLLGVEAVVFFDPAKAWEFELRRKRGGHLFSKHRFLSAQMQAYLADNLWLRLAVHANDMAARLWQGIAALPHAALTHPSQANIVFANWEAGGHDRLQAAGAIYYDLRPTPEGRETARMVTSWNTTTDHVDDFVTALRG